MGEVVKKWYEVNRKSAEFLKNATDEDFKRMFSECMKVEIPSNKQK